MQKSKLETAIAEAERFLKKAKVLQKMVKKNESDYIGYCAETATVRRSSMDLTRALADLRKY